MRCAPCWETARSKAAFWLCGQDTAYGLLLKTCPHQCPLCGGNRWLKRVENGIEVQDLCPLVDQDNACAWPVDNGRAETPKIAAGNGSEATP